MSDCAAPLCVNRAAPSSTHCDVHYRDDPGRYVPDAAHGTWSGYHRDGCRCPVCLEAK